MSSGLAIVLAIVIIIVTIIVMAAISGGRRQREQEEELKRAASATGVGASTARSFAMGVPKGKEQLGKTIAEGEGFFAKLAQKAAGLAFDKAIDVYFGDGPGQEVDAGAMRRVATDTPGFIVMAADKDEGTRILSQGLEKALIDAANDTSSVLAHEDRPWILLRPKAVALALTRVFTFGRRSLS
jgi:hypothetical protein